MSDEERLDLQLEALFQARDRDDMEPTILALTALLDRNPDHPGVLYELGGAYDTAGREAEAAELYERALASGLDGRRLRQCLLQYGSTLRNLGRSAESVTVLGRAREQFPDSESLAIFHALSLHAAGRSDAAVGELLVTIAERFATPEVVRYRAAIRGNGEHLLELDRACR